MYIVVCNLTNLQLRVHWCSSALRPGRCCQATSPHLPSTDRSPHMVAILQACTHARTHTHTHTHTHTKIWLYFTTKLWKKKSLTYSLGVCLVITAFSKGTIICDCDRPLLSLNPLPLPSLAPSPAPSPSLPDASVACLVAARYKTSATINQKSRLPNCDTGLSLERTWRLSACRVYHSPQLHLTGKAYRLFL